MLATGPGTIGRQRFKLPAARAGPLGQSPLPEPLEQPAAAAAPRAWPPRVPPGIAGTPILRRQVALPAPDVQPEFPRASSSHPATVGRIAQLVFGSDLGRLQRGALPVQHRDGFRRLPKRASSSSSCVRRQSSTFCNGNRKGVIAWRPRRRPGRRQLPPVCRRGLRERLRVRPISSVSRWSCRRNASSSGRSRMLASSPGFDPAT